MSNNLAGVDRRGAVGMSDLLCSKGGIMSLQDIDSSFQFGEDPPWDEQDSSKIKETGLIPRADWFVQATGDNADIVTAVRSNEKLRGDWISTRMAVSGNGTEEDPYDLFVGDFLADSLEEIKEILDLLYAAKAKGNRIDIELFCAVKIPDPKGDVLVMQVSIGSANAPFVDIMPGIRHFFQVWGG